MLIKQLYTIIKSVNFAAESYCGIAPHFLHCDPPSHVTALEGHLGTTVTMNMHVTKLRGSVETGTLYENTKLTRITASPNLILGKGEHYSSDSEYLPLQFTAAMFCWYS
jgi:hypothetical protein